MNAIDRYDANIDELSNSGFPCIEINSMDYRLEDLLREAEKPINRIKWGRDMGFLKELHEAPKVTVDDVTYVPKDIYKTYVIARLEVLKEDAFSQDEIDGIDEAIKVVFNS